MILSVNASKKYDIIIEENFEKFKTTVSPLIKGEKVAIITDTNVNKLFVNFLDKHLKNKQVFTFIVKAGEKSKNIKNYSMLLNNLAKNNFTRNDTIITFGGGVVGDLGAFTASTYMRGINLIAVPTTLLSMVDSSVGGKTAINIKYGKNLCGTFYQPSMVYIDLEFLDKLPKREIISGMGEAIKYTYLTDTDSLQNGKITEQLIYNCLKIKADIVEKDERESNIRKLLNFGHTIGHAIERLSNFQLSHGECVIKGIKYALDISKKYFNIKDEKMQPLYARLNNFDLSCQYSKSDILECIKCDKKANSNSVDMVLINGNLKAQIVKITFEKLKELL